MYMKIYQPRPGEKRFLSLEEAGGTADPAKYEQVFCGDLDASTPEEVFLRFNMKCHPLFRGYSLSVGDVVTMGGQSYYCQPVRFQEIDFDESRVPGQDDLLRIVYVEPNRPAFESMIPDKLNYLQQAVQGPIEVIHLGEGALLVCNEEGKLRNLTGCRRIDSTIIAGAFFIVGDDGENFRSLTEQETSRWLERFSQPEEITQKEVSDDMWFKFYTF